MTGNAQITGESSSKLSINLESQIDQRLLVLSYVYSKQPIFVLTHEWLRDVSFSRLECGVPYKLHISNVDWRVLCFPWHRHQIEGTDGFSVSSERHRDTQSVM